MLPRSIFGSAPESNRSFRWLIAQDQHEKWFRTP